ncbi:MAG TPA: Fe-S cluster assembly protein SufD [Phycisphaerae bacterium]|nr:Fe-S cluster assembly protein SufD [Phycisphaerae bacterium]
MTEKQQMHSAYIAHFQRRATSLTNDGGAWFVPTREAALACFSRLGFPTLRHEEWKYTNVAPIAQTAFEPAAPGAAQVTLDQIEPYTFADDACTRLVFVNGWFVPELSSSGAASEGVVAGSLIAAMRTHRELIEPHLARHAAFEDQAFVALNTALMQDGAFVHVAKRRVVSRPIHLLFVSTTEGRPLVAHPRNLILADADSQATVIESHVSLDGAEAAACFTNPVTEIVASEHAVVDYYKIQRQDDRAYHVGALQLHQYGSSNISAHTISLGGSLVRHDINALLDAEGCECTLNGLYMVNGRQQVDNHLRVVHARPHCNSREFFKGVLDDRARGAFTGRIVVHPDAQKTDAKQSNMNLLLSADAQVDSKPQLEIFADDVKCTHGATIGQVDEEAVFYLRSRGMSRAAARGLLIHAFAREAVEGVRFDALREQLEGLIFTRLSQGDMLQEA